MGSFENPFLNAIQLSAQPPAWQQMARQAEQSRWEWPAHYEAEWRQGGGRDDPDMVFARALDITGCGAVGACNFLKVCPCTPLRSLCMASIEPA